MSKDWSISPSEFPCLALPGLHLLTCRTRREAGQAQKSHAHPGIIEFHYLHEGFLAFQLGDNEVILRSGDVYITFPGESHGSRGVPMGLNKTYFLRVDLETHEPLFGLPREEATALLEILAGFNKAVFFAGSDLRTLFDKTQSRYRKWRGAPSVFERILLRNALIELIHQLWISHESDGVRMLSPMIKRALRQLDSDPGFSLKHAVASSGMSMSTFQHRFKGEVGISFSEYQLRKRMERCIHAFHDPRLSLTDIALQNGFYSSQQFSSQFRRIVGMSPSAYRKQPPIGAPQSLYQA